MIEVDKNLIKFILRRTQKKHKKNQNDYFMIVRKYFKNKKNKNRNILNNTTQKFKSKI